MRNEWVDILRIESEPCTFLLVNRRSSHNCESGQKPKHDRFWFQGVAAPPIFGGWADKQAGKRRIKAELPPPLYIRRAFPPLEFEKLTADNS